MNKRRYVTTAIDFPNAAPHMGHVYEKILADIMVRWFRLNGDEVRFHVGTDENGIKIQQTAKAQGITPKELVEKNRPAFEELFRTIGISFDYFIKTSVPEGHWPTVTELWNKLKAAGALEKRTYTGLYCSGCERFWRATDLVDGKCPDHDKVPEEVTEENWFFLLSKEQDFLKKLLDPKNPAYKMIPAWRGNEVHAFLEGGLEDISFSRSKKTLYWGVPVPGDDDQVMYVWCDNLTSYISSLGYFTDHEQKEWWDEAEVTHVIGKDIARFHALNWPAMLHGTGTKTPDQLFIHGFITSEGQKMSKSLGNVVDPQEVLAKYGVDPLRFYLASEVPVGNDGDFSWKRFGEVYDAVLRNKLGNLLNRVLTLLKKDGGTVSVPTGGESLQQEWQTYREAMDAFESHKAIHVAVEKLRATDIFIASSEPWKKEGQERSDILATVAEHLRHVALMLLPFVPDTAQRVSRQLGVPYAEKMSDRSFVLSEELQQWGGCKDWKAVGEQAILFAPVE